MTLDPTTLDPTRFEPRDRDVAVVGMAGRFPGAPDLDAFWRLLAEGREAMTFFTDDELRAAGVPEELIANPDYVKAGSLLEGVEEFDAGFFGYTAREAEILDPQQRLFLEHAWAALEDAGHVPERYPGLVGIYAGVAWNTYLLSNLREHRELFEGGGAFQVFITNDKDFMPTRASYKLNLKGPSLVVQTSCSTSLVAIHLAALSLLNYECDMALAGGVTVKVPQEAGYFYQDGGLASPDGHCRAFDADAAGTVFGSGVGVVVLKRLAEAIEDGDTIRAVLRGSAINNDGSVKVSYTAPSVEGQAEVIAAAQAVAEVEPRSIGFVECHGTGTSLGDPIEVAALTRVFRESTEDRDFCLLGSVKSNVGHLDAAAGVAGFLKAVLALEHGQVPPVASFERPNPRIDFASSPFRVATGLAPWPAGDGPRRAAVSSFGVGGTNAHAILQEAPKPAPPAPSRPWQLLLLSARSEAALDAATADLGRALGNGVPAGGSLADVAWTLSVGRRPFPHRRFLVAATAAEAAQRLADREGPPLPAGRAPEDEGQRRPVAFLLPGQGAQHPDMGRELYSGEAAFREALDRCAELFREPLDLDLREVLYPPAGADREAAAPRLEDTALAQPALFAVEYALARLWMEWGVLPDVLLGHSLGELVAATLAGVFSLEDGVALVAERGRLMASAPPGAMLAVPLSPAELEGRLPEGVELAAVNEPSRCTVSGPEEAIGAFAAALEEEGVGARRLHTSHAFHSALMDGAVEPFRRAVERVRLSPPSIPFVSNLTGTWITDAEATDPAYWARHLRGAVRFADGLEHLLEEDRVLLEVGPGHTLSTLARRHPSREGRPVVPSLPRPGVRRGAGDEGEGGEGEGGAADPAGDAGASVLAALGRLWMAGVDVDQDGYWQRETRRRLPLPTYPFERRRYWIDAGPGRTAAARSDAPAAFDPAEAGKRNDVGSWFYRPSWEEAPVPPPPVAGEEGSDALPRRWWLLAEGPLADSLEGHLVARGCTVHRVAPDPGGGGLSSLSAAEATAPGSGAARRWSLRPAAADDWAALAGATGGPPDAVVHAWSLGDGTAPETHAPAFDAAQERGLLALTALLRGVPEAPLDLTVVADRLLAVVHGEVLDPARAPLLAAVRVLPEERPGAGARAVDPGGTGRPDPDRLARRLLAEVGGAAAGPGDAADAALVPEEIALRGPQRWVRRYRATPLPAPADAASPLREGAHHLLVGGLAGNGLALARFLARHHGARLTLIEDAVEAAAGEERRRRVADLEALGGTLHLEVVDLADRAAVAAAVAGAVERWGMPTGILHAADTYGERTFRVLAETGAEEAAWHFRPRLHALEALGDALDGVLAAARERDPEAPGPAFAAVVSSLATVLGGLAYGAYTAGCLAADAWVEERNRRAPAGALPWLALDWDVWRFEAEERQITSLRPDLAALAMSPEEGEDAFLRAVGAVAAGGPGGRWLVSTGSLPGRLARRRQRIAAHGPEGAAAAAGGDHPRPDLDVPYRAPESDLEKRIAGVWRELLGFERIGLDDHFFELGGDSFVAVRVASRLKEVLGTDLPVAQLYEALTVRELARLLEAAGRAGEERASRLEERREAGERRRDVLARRRDREGATR